MINKDKSGKSLILLAIVICVMSLALVFVCRFFYNNDTTTAQEKAFKTVVYEYCQEIESYKQQISDDKEKELEEVCGVELKAIIPDINDTDMSKFKIENGKLIYIGMDANEMQWTQEVKI